MSPRPIVSPDWIARLGDPRSLRFAASHAAEDLPAHVRAGSGLRRWGGKLVVVQDDVNALALVDDNGLAEPLYLPFGASGRRQFSEADGNKAEKMDLEGCVTLPDGRLLALGSGSTAARERIVLVSSAHEVRVVDARPLSERLRAVTDFAGSELNVEGAVVVGGKLRLFQRGNGRVVDGVAPRSSIGDVDLLEFLRWIDDDDRPPSLRAITQVELGHIQGVPLGFTDATALPDGRVIFLAGAEDSPDTYHDGAVLGARVGILSGADTMLAPILDTQGEASLLKLEGIDFLGIRSSGAIDFVVVADMDDPSVPAALMTLTWGP